MSKGLPGVRGILMQYERAKQR